MLKRIISGLGAVIATAIAFFVFEYGVVMGYWQPLLRPSGVPSTAHFASLGGKETTWFDCSVDLQRNVNHCRAWDDDGRLKVDDDFRLDEAHRAANASELKPSHVLWYNGKVYLICLFGHTGDCTLSLIPVKKVKGESNLPTLNPVPIGTR